jgi:hypothetical protein
VIFRILDIETIPDERFWHRNEPTYRLTAPRSSWQDGLKKHAALVEEVDVVPPPPACRVVAIAYLDMRFDPANKPCYWYVGSGSVCRWSGVDEEADRLERQMLLDFSAQMEAEQSINLVTWNGRGFDLPVIMMRSLHHRLPQTWYYKNRDMRYRFSAEGHCDLMDFLGDYGSARYMKLDDVAKSIGLPGKTDMSGDQVLGRYRRAVAIPELDVELREEVSRYCLQDVVQTAIVWIGSRVLLGKIVPETHDLVLDTLRSSPEVQAAIDLPWDRLYAAGGARA